MVAGITRINISHCALNCVSVAAASEVCAANLGRELESIEVE
jgi:hypothetical protein